MLLPAVDGLSFLPTLKQQAEQKEHAFLYWERHSPDGASHAQAVRFGGWKAVKTTQNNGVQLALFNLKDDGSEKHDAAAQHPDRVRQAEAYLQTRRLAAIPEWNFAKPIEAE